MKKGSYTVQENVEFGAAKGHTAPAPSWAGPAPRPPDSSFTACLLTLIFFFGLCVIVLLAVWPWNSDKQTYPTTDEDNPVHEGFSGNNATTAPHAGHEGGDTGHEGGDTDHEGGDTDHEGGDTGHEGGDTDHETGTTTEDIHSAGLEPDIPVVPGTDEEDDYDESTHHRTTTRSPTHHSTVRPSKGGKKGANGTKGDSKHPSKGDEDSGAEWVEGEGRGEGRGGGTKERLVSYEGGNTTVGTKDTTLEESHLTSNPPTRSTTKAEVPRMRDTTPTLPTSPPNPVPRSTTEEPATTGPSLSEDLSARTIPPPEKRTCASPVCKSLSSRMLAFMNHSADPCENFYDYACGGMRSINSAWIKEVPKNTDSWSRLSDMIRRVDTTSPMSHQKLKSFYESCKFYREHADRRERINKMRGIIGKIGRFYSSDEWVEGSGILTELIGRLLKYNFSPLLDIILDVDSHDNSKFALRLTAPVFISPFGDSGETQGDNLSGWPKQSCIESATAKPESHEKVDFNQRYEEYTNCSENYEYYVSKSREAVQQVGIFRHLNETQMSKLITESVLYLDMILGAITPNILPKPGQKKQKLLAKEYTEYTIKNLMEKFPSIDWKKLISMLLDYDVPEETIVQVYFESYFKSLFEELEKNSIDERRLVNALMVMFTHELYYGLVMNRQSCDRETYCLKVSRKLMDDVSSALFLKSFGSEKLSTLKNLITEKFNELILSLKSEISKMPWMDAVSQTSALEKARHMKLFADGGAEVFLNDTYLDSQFHEIDLNSVYLENAILLLQRYRKRMYGAYHKDPSNPEQIWSHFLLPFDDHGKVLYGLNAIVVPYGMMSKPFFSEDYPKYVQMASLGHIIAREIWHQFDTAGILYDAKGSKKSLLSGPSKAKMERLTECITQQYATEHIEFDDEGHEFSYKLNTKVSLNERFADIGASHLAYQSLWGPTAIPSSFEETLPWSSMTPQQLFFLSMAQNFCTKSSVYDYIVLMFESELLPPFTRINDIAFNSRDFMKAFSCSTKTPCDPFNIALS